MEHTAHLAMQHGVTCAVNITLKPELVCEIWDELKKLAKFTNNRHHAELVEKLGHTYKMQVMAAIRGTI